MTPEERWAELRDLTEGFNKKNLIHHHMVRTITEALAELQAENALLWDVLEAVQALSDPEYVINPPTVMAGPELDELNRALAKAPKKRHVDNSPRT